MAYLFLLILIVFSALLSIFGSLFNKKNASFQGFAMLYNVIVIGSACFSWGIIYLTDFSFDAGVIPYALGYAIGYAMALISLFKALECGPVSLTALLKSISIIMPSFWGFLFWGEIPTSLIIIGMILVLASLILCFVQKSKGKKQDIPAKWFFYVLLLVIGNGGSLILQNYQQRAFDGAHKNMLMFFATGVATLITLVLFLAKRKENTLTRAALSKTFYIPIATGVSSAVFNLVLMVVRPLLPASLIYPATAVGAIIVTTLFSAIVCRERLRPMQWVGLGVGCVALVFLNL